MSVPTLPPGGPDTDLLFAALALQLDFVTRDELLEALDIWATDRGQSIGRILVQRHLISPHRRHLIDELLSEYLIQHGMDAARGLAAACARRPEGVDFARFRIAINDVPTVSFPTHDAPTKTPEQSLGIPIEGPPSGVGLSTSAGKRFRKIQLHAQGALGQVFLAHDDELNRQVALKEIQESYANHPDCRSRFLLEAEITGSLEHPGVVPVYGLGLHADGRPYYAMRFIRGESLHDAIQRFHKADGPRRSPGERALALRALLGRFAAICNTIAFAHSRGVLHRDIKPSNVMLGPFGETLVVDWGLAKAIDPSVTSLSSSNTPFSRPSLHFCQDTIQGQAVGTPAFMSPEAASGNLDRINIGSDIYSLGATLYNILTGVPPFSGDDASYVLMQVQLNAFPSPQQIKRTIPLALEAVVLKAMAASPAQRYANAADLEHDVQRWLADEPVKAYREPLGAQMLRWARHHREVVTGLAAVIVSTFLFLVWGLFAVSQQKKAIARERDTAEYNFRLARKAVDECFILATEDPLLQQAKMRGVRRLLLQKALPFYEGFKTQNPDRDDISLEVARNHFNVAYITSDIGRASDAIEPYERARTVFRALVDTNPGEGSLRVDLARVHNNLGLALQATGRHDEALQELKTALQLRDRLVAQNAEIPEYQNDLAATDNNLGALYRDLNAPQEAQRHFGFARDTLDRLVRTHPNSLRYKVALAATLHNLGRLYAENGDFERARDSYRDARRIRAKLVDDNPQVAEFRSELASTLTHIGTLVHIKEPKQAEELFSKSQELCEGIVKEYPEVAMFRFDLACACNGLGRLLHDQTNRSLTLHSRARGLLEELVKDNPEEYQYAVALAGTYLNLGRAHASTSKPEEALSWFDRIPPQIAQLPFTERSRPEPRTILRNAYWSKAEVLGKIGKHPEALLCWNEAVKRSDPVELDILQGRAASLARCGKHAEASREAEAILEHKRVSNEIQYETACVLSLASAAAKSDPALTPAQRKTEEERLGARAMQLLKTLIDRNFFQKAEMIEHLEKNDKDLDPLRRRDDFPALVRKARAARQPDSN